MTENNPVSAVGSLDPADDAPEWTEAMFAEAEIAVGGKIARPGKWRTADWPPLVAAPKKQATLRLDPDAIDRFRAGVRG